MARGAALWTTARRWAALAALAGCWMAYASAAAQTTAADEPPPEIIVRNDRPVLKIPEAEAADEASMKPYTERIIGTTVTFDMVPIRGGKFVMGSPADEPDRSQDEGPQHEVVIEPFWMGKCEVTWDEYEIWSFNLDIKLRTLHEKQPTALDKLADAVTRPTPPYTDMTFGMGKSGYPAICMTQLAAKKYCEWLSAKTGRYYRLPTEAEWEYACRAGNTGEYGFGNDARRLGEFAWFSKNSGGKTHPVGTKKPNDWGLYDMHGNVWEWCADLYEDGYYKNSPAQDPAGPPVSPSSWVVVRGAAWISDAASCRSARRFNEAPARRHPGIGFRVVAVPR
jgi:formylglycine-generating enzyme required for sulfatase activity